MVDLLSSELDLLFYALSDPTRRSILAKLNQGTRSITELAEPFNISFAAVAKHIKILEKAKLINRSKQGRVQECEINPSAFKTIEECVQFYSKFWADGLDSFAESLHNEKKK